MELAIGTKFCFKGNTYIVSEKNQACAYCDLNQGKCLAAMHRDIVGPCNMISRKDRKNVVFKEIKDMSYNKVTNKKNSVADILRDMPKGTKLYSPAFGEVTFEEVHTELDIDFIFASDKNGSPISFEADGKYKVNGECMLFPSKEMRDWSKLLWKKGNVLISESGRVECLFNGFCSDDFTTFNGEHFILTHDNGEVEYLGEMSALANGYTIEDLSNVKCYINTIEERFEGKLNMETLEIEKLEVHEGDRIEYTTTKGDKYVGIVKSMEDRFINLYVAYNFTLDSLSYDVHVPYGSVSFKRSNREICKDLHKALKEEGKYWNDETMQIENIKPKCEFRSFDKVLVRDKNTEVWKPAFFSHYQPDIIDEFAVIASECAAYCMCIPYNKETAKLIGTTNNYK